MNYKYPQAIGALYFYPHTKGEDGEQLINTRGLSMDPTPREVGEFLGAEPGDMWKTCRVSEFGHWNQYRMFSDPKTIAKRERNGIEPQYGWIWPQYFDEYLDEDFIPPNDEKKEDNISKEDIISKTKTVLLRRTPNHQREHMHTGFEFWHPMEREHKYDEFGH